MIIAGLEDLIAGIRRMLPDVGNTLSRIAKAAEAFEQAHSAHVILGDLPPARVVQIATVATDGDGVSAIVALDDRGCVWVMRCLRGETSARGWDRRPLPDLA